MTKKFQFFTTDQGLMYGTWFPMDHFFYAPCIDNKGGGFVEKNKIVHLEGHVNLRNASGYSVSVIHGKETEEFDTIPAALRRMADIIEAHTTKNA